ncbi:MAG: leucine-rich repeat domain-containing protein [Parabacteroides sp.]|nr:leucine-rich repeat domain-containing protein [Parabacteroides sp.]
MPTIKDSSSIEEVLQYIVACYGAEIYQEKQRLSNLIADLYTGEERLKRLYRRMVMEDAVSQQLYAISLKPIQEREGFYNRLVFQFKEANFYEEAFARQVLDVFLHGMNLLLVEPISTKATEEDGKWVDEYGVMYSADRKKLIRAPGGLNRYRILDGTVAICDGAFRWRDSMREITLPPSVTSIGDEAFCECENLQEIIIPPNVTSIGNNAFSSCRNLQEITIPSSVTNIGRDVFSSCWNLQEINVTESNKFYRAIDGVLYTKDLKTIICYPQGKGNEKFIIPSSVTRIENEAFRYCGNLQEITLPPSVTSIGDNAFEECIILQEITLPSGVTSIGDGAFYRCCSLQEISLPSGVTSVGDRAFMECSNLQKITLSSRVTSIGDYAFWHCGNLQEITLPSNVTSIGDNAFLACRSLETIILPSSVTSIGDSAFLGCKNLCEITLPSSATSIGDYAFERCENLERINIPAGTLEKFKKLLPNEAHLLREV